MEFRMDLDTDPPYWSTQDSSKGRSSLCMKYAILQAAALRAATNDIPSNLSGGNDRVVSWYDYEDVLKRLLDDNSAYREADGQ